MSITIERFERFPCRAETAPRKKRAWIDPEQKLVSFHEIPQARLLECEEERFWVSVLRFVAAATASSSAFRLAPPEKTW